MFYLVTPEIGSPVTLSYLSGIGTLEEFKDTLLYTSDTRSFCTSPWLRAAAVNIVQPEDLVSTPIWMEVVRVCHILIADNEGFPLSIGTPYWVSE